MTTGVLACPIDWIQKPVMLRALFLRGNFKGPEHGIRSPSMQTLICDKFTIRTEPASTSAVACRASRRRSLLACQLRCEAGPPFSELLFSPVPPALNEPPAMLQQPLHPSHGRVEKIPTIVPCSIRRSCVERSTRGSRRAIQAARRR
jgi:hypothetical protein